jgi:hypothetical protein
MTMPPPAHHPDPERLAALAGDDAEARTDRALTEHVASCAECGPTVGDMSTLRAALAQLPDLAPSRPLQLVPPVPASASSGWRVAFRRAFAPVAVAGMVLVLVGGVGATGALGPAEAPRLSFSFFQIAASAPDQGQPEVDDGGGVTEPSDGGERPSVASAPPAEPGGAGALGPTPAPTLVPTDEVGGQGVEEEPSSRGEDLDAESRSTSGWVVVLAGGLGLLVVAVALRALAPKRMSAGR